MRSEPLFQHGRRADEGFGACMIGVSASGQHGIPWQRMPEESGRENTFWCHARICYFGASCQCPGSS